MPTVHAHVALVSNVHGTVELHNMDADDRFPGRFVARVNNDHDINVRITPGNSWTYVAAGFHWVVEERGGLCSYSGEAATVPEALAAAAEAFDLIASGEAFLEPLD